MSISVYYIFPDRSFEKEINPSKSEPFRNLFLNHFEPIQKTYWVSFDASHIKINPALSGLT